MNRMSNILNTFEKIAGQLPKPAPSDRIKNIMQKAAICPQMMGLGMEEVGIIDKDQIEGGVADGKSTEEIAEDQNITPEEVDGAVDEGKAVEMEHTDDANMAGEIAKDHIDETTPEYYDKLDSMEEELKVDKEVGLDDPSPEDKEIILRFLQTQSDLDDGTLHKLYMSLGVDPHEGEEIVYAAAGEALGDDPAKAQEVAQNVEEKEVEVGEEPDAGEVTTEEMQAKPEEDKKSYVKMAADLKDKLDAFVTMFGKQAEAPPVAERKGPEDEDDQDDKEVPTQIAENSPENLPPKGVSAKSDETEERKKEEDAQSQEKNEKVAAQRDGTGPEGKGPRTGRGKGTCPPEDVDTEDEDVKKKKKKLEDILEEKQAEQLTNIKQLSAQLGLVKE